MSTVGYEVKESSVLDAGGVLIAAEPAKGIKKVRMGMAYMASADRPVRVQCEEAKVVSQRDGWFGMASAICSDLWPRHSNRLGEKRLKGRSAGWVVDSGDQCVIKVGCALGRCSSKVQ